MTNGIELAASFVEKRRDDYIKEHGSYDYDTGFTEFPGDGLEYVGELDEIIEGIRALSAPASAAELEDRLQEAFFAGWAALAKALDRMPDHAGDDYRKWRKTILNKETP